MTSNISNITQVIYGDIAGVVFSNIHPKENLLTMTLVCKVWMQTATHVAKQQFIEERKRELSEKLRPCLELTGTGFRTENFIPALKTLKDEIDTFSAHKIYDQLSGLTETKQLSIQSCSMLSADSYDGFKTGTQGLINAVTQIVAEWEQFIVQNPDQLNQMTDALQIPRELTDDRKKELLQQSIAHFQSILDGVEQRKNDMLGKAFINLCSTDESGEGISMWTPNSGVRMFPIELFNLQIQGENRELVGPKSGTTHYFPLDGKLIEVILVANHQNFPAPESAQMVPPQMLFMMSPKSYYNINIHGMPRNLT